MQIYASQISRKIPMIKKIPPPDIRLQFLYPHCEQNSIASHPDTDPEPCLCVFREAA